MEEVPEQLDRWLFLKVNFVEHLKVAYVGHRIWSNVLRMELEARKHISEKL